MTEQQLIQELERNKIIDEDSGNRVLREAELSGKSAEIILYEKKLADEPSVIKVKSALIGVPYKKVDVSAVPEMLLKVVPQETYTAYRVIPIEQKERMLIVGMFRPDDAKAQNALKFIAKQQGLDLGVYLISFSDWVAMGRRYSPYKSEVSAAVQELGNVKTEDRAIDLEEGGKGEEAPVIKIVASTLREAVEAGASDVHIEPQRNSLRIRFRIDGTLHDVATLPSSLTQPITSRIKVLAKMKLDETRIPQDGRFRTNFQDHEIDYRVASFPTPAGEKIAIRVLDPKTGLRGLDQLGISEYNARIIDEALAKPYGMVLISGPTGSGKSTTLYAMLSRLNKESVNIVTLEDPVEYFMEGISQSQVRPEIDYTFASGLRQILRQDPDVIMIGEMRDPETIATAMTAAETGHLVFSTLHTNSASQTIDRIIDSFPPEQQGQISSQLASTLVAIVSQRLVPRLGGGRIPATEIMITNSAIKNLIRERKIYQIDLVIETSAQEGMISLNRSLVNLVKRHEISLEEAEANSLNPSELRLLLERS